MKRRESVDKGQARASSKRDHREGDEGSGGVNLKEGGPLSASTIVSAGRGKSSKNVSLNDS